MDARESKTSETEREREKMMEQEADDLGFRMHRRPGTGTSWGVLGAILLAALAVPLFYLAFGLASGVASTRGGMILTVAFMVLLVACAIGGVYMIARGRDRRTPYIPEDEREDQQLFGGNRKMNSYKRVNELMTQHPVACGHLDSIAECAKILYRYNVGCAVITDDQQRCLGLITDRDIVCAGVAQGMDLAATPVTSLMERELRSIRPEQSVDEVVSVMRDGGVRRVVVLEGQKCVGLISIDDLIAHRAISIDDAAGVLTTQLSEPNAQHDVRGEVEDRVA